MRPTEYRAEYCEKVVEWGRLGKSRAWIAASLGVVRQTVANWEHAHPEFLDAMTYAKLLEQQWWEDAGQTGMREQIFGQSVWSRSMAARFPDDWREKVAHVGGDKGDNPIQQEVSLTADAFTGRILGAHARAATESGTGGDPGENQG